MSPMSSTEKILVGVLGIVILGALIGIGVLAARLVMGENGDRLAVTGQVPTSAPLAQATTAPGAAAPAAAATGATIGAATPAASAAGATITPVAPPELDEPDAQAPAPAGGQPAVVARSEGLGPLSPVLIVSQPLRVDHRYRIEIAAADGSRVAIQGSWSQAALSASGQMPTPQIEFFEATTPYRLDLVPPVTDPTMWSCSVSAGRKELVMQGAGLVIEILDVTGIP